MNKNKYLFVVNPKSGKGKATQLIKKAIEQLKDFITYDIYITKPLHYANELKQIIAYENFTHIIAVGGDGTANEVLNAIIGTDAVMGIFPFGSGNDFAGHLKLPRKISELVQMIKSDKVKKIDCGKAGDTYFINYISFGLDAEINKKAELYKKFLPASTAYIIAVFHALISHKGKNLFLNGVLKQIHLLAVHNGSLYGGGIPMNPNANCNDGELNLIYVDKMWKIQILGIFPTIFMGLHQKFKKVHFSTFKNFTVDSHNPILTAIDGESYDFHYPLDIEVKPQEIKFLHNSI